MTSKMNLKYDDEEEHIVGEGREGDWDMMKMLPSFSV